MLARTVTVLGAAIAAAALLMVIASIRLVLEDPVAVADAVGGRGGQALVHAVAQMIIQALRGVVRWL